MPSLKSRAFLFVLRNRHLFRFQKKRQAFDMNTSIQGFREECEKGARMFGDVPEDIVVQQASIEGIKAEWILPKGANKDKIIFFTHGGGYVSGSCSDHRMHVAKFVKESGVGALLFEYRLAPEHPYPAAIEDTLKAYRWLLDQGTLPSNIVIMGDSAGGGLALAALLAFRDEGLPLPSAAVAISPWTDLKCTGESYKTNTKVCLSPLNSWTVFAKHYYADNDPGLPLISPLYGDLHGLPPILIYAAGDEILRDDSIRFAEKAKAAGVDVRLHVEPGMFHCYPVAAPVFPEAVVAMKDICSFVKMHTEKVQEKV